MIAEDGPLNTQSQAQLWIRRMTVRSFRCVDELSVEFEPGITYLVGENNAGKSSILAALSVALGASRGSVDDLARSSNGVVSERASIDLIIAPRGERFGDNERQRLTGNVHTDPSDNTEFVGIRTVLTPSREGGQLISARSFLQPGRHGIVESRIEFTPAALSLFECELLDASRDLVAELGSKSSRWGRVLFDLHIPDPEPEVVDGVAVEPHPTSRKGLEKSLQSLAGQMRSASPVLQSLEDQLGRLAKVQSSVSKVQLQPFPPQIEEVMRSIDILIGGIGGPALPLRFHGMGSRSLASLFVFSALCALRLGADSALVPHLLTLIEEPEAHLHPQAISGLRDELERLPGQRVVSTHSAHLISEVQPSSIRVVKRDGPTMEVRKISTSTLADTARFRRFVERPFGEMFFARLVIFGDGATERDSLPVLLSHALGTPVAALGVTIVDCESMDHPQISKLVSAVTEIGVPWLVFGDNDESGAKALAKITDPDTGKPLTATSNRVVIAGAKAMEQLLLDADYGPEIIEIANENGECLGADATKTVLLRFLKSNKGWVGEVVVKRALKAGKPVPTCVAELARKAALVLGVVSPEGKEAAV